MALPSVSANALGSILFYFHQLHMGSDSGLKLIVAWQFGCYQIRGRLRSFQCDPYRLGKLLPLNIDCAIPLSRTSTIQICCIGWMYRAISETVYFLKCYQCYFTQVSILSSHPTHPESIIRSNYYLATTVPSLPSCVNRFTFVSGVASEMLEIGSNRQRNQIEDLRRYHGDELQACNSVTDD
ncbi:hypothetical protein B0O99DRAFT_262603 [Bisporella sp. PMI_857]|nr:hypothetical protein B0O99DRAFT_262603 [Bisporella sp. PMI_857]